MLKKTIAKNGITVITDRAKHSRICTIGYLVRAGAYNELPEEKGVAHLVEHMLFKGTEKRTYSDISREIEGVGGELNAETGYDYTFYHSTVPSDKWEVSLDVLSDMIFNSVISDEELKKEKKVISEEIKMNYDDSVSFIFNRQWELMHKSYPCRQNILGTKETLEKLTREKIFSFMKKYYHNSNLVIIATGNIVHDEMVKWVEAFKTANNNYNVISSDLSLKKNGIINRKAFVPDKLDFQKITFKRKELEQVHLAWGLFFPPPQSSDYYAMEILSVILGENSSSRLFTILREEKGLAYHIHVDYETINDCGILSGYAGTDPGRINEVIDIIWKETVRFTEELVSEEEISRAVSYILGDLMISLDDTQGKSKFIADAVINNTYFKIEKIKNKFLSVTSENLMALAKKYIKKDNAMFLTLVKE